MEQLVRAAMLAIVAAGILCMGAAQRPGPIAYTLSPAITNAR